MSRSTGGFATVLLLLLLSAGCGGPPAGPQEETSLAGLLGGDEGNAYARALAPRPFRFPADHGPHPQFKTEWWYFTGNLDSPEGRHFGFQLTFFRNAISPDPLPGDSRWRTRQVYMAHFALTDVAGGRFFAGERFERAALGLAGARSDPFSVWLAGWEAESDAGAFPMHLQADDAGTAIDLTLDTLKPPVLQGEAGLSRKSDRPGHNSYYYSMSRLKAQGRVTVAGREFAVSGLAWMDREWSSAPLAPNQVGWDWFALQLDDGRELMFYRLRRTDGSPDPASSGTLIGTEGDAQHLSADDVQLEVTGRWRSPRGTRYPASWRIEVPGEGISLRIEPYLPDQELDLTVRYWEGAVRVSGTRQGRPVAGSGYVELTGY